jgi:hypothetical protein
VWVAERHSVYEPDGRTPYKGGELTVRHVLNIEGVGMVRAQQALALGLVKPEQLNMPAATKSEQRLKEGQQSPTEPAADPNIRAAYIETATALNTAVEKAGGNVDAVLNEFAKGEAPGEGAMQLIARVSEQVGQETLNEMAGALEAYVYDAASRALPQGADFDAVMDVIENQPDQRRWSQAWVHLLRSGDAGLVQQMVRETAKGLR